MGAVMPDTLRPFDLVLPSYNVTPLAIPPASGSDSCLTQLLQFGVKRAGKVAEMLGF